MENFEKLLQQEINKLPFNKGLDDGQYNDGQIAGFELGARWLLKIIKNNGVLEDVSDIFSKNDMICYANYVRNGLTNIEYSNKNEPEHLEYWKSNYR